ncbi:TetR/AcrR family transcriptional regulator [Radiobacillus kanasensis]|uniref:TetR/AcrR family transcriptional regulator n=1 Tax=Radiobacillus kanasensis TaxID=2844358 RepID=UPI001E4B11A7|nr:TetR/AcrR family transcriptional regulator [Radiobacillus kanasensis]UFT99239.1 TetR/AcrR family transcriptional regulator [Radiobacillus kanasensis]
MSKRRYDSEQVKKEIAHHASLLFTQKGYNQTSISDIAKTSGHSKGHIYYHFENKEKLFAQLALQSMDDWKRKWEIQQMKLQTAEDKLHGIAQFVLHNYQSPLLRAGQELGAHPNTSPETLQAIMQVAVIPMNAYRSIFQEGIRQGEFLPGNVEEWTTLLGTWLGGLCQLTESQEAHTLESLFEQAITIFITSIKTK